MRPNLIVIVMDCVRHSDFLTEGTSERYLPFATQLGKECVRYDRAVSPATWTVPSHASLFTSRYPWEHGTYARAKLRLDPGLPTLASHLGGMGYATLSLSANFLISSHIGLTNGFETATWGGWWEPYLRIPERFTRNRNRLLPPGKGWPMKQLPKTPLWTVLQNASATFFRFQSPLDLLQRVTTRLKGEGTAEDTKVAPWLEPTLQGWLDKRPADQPMFAFLNLLDAHEPYYSTPELFNGLWNWLRYARIRQDKFGWAEGKWRVQDEDLEVLHQLYRHAIQILDRRLERIVRLLKDHDRWDNSIVVVTSDHGQQFGEFGGLFHVSGISESLVRIPFLVHYPGGANGGGVDRRWVSLLDIAPTVCELIESPHPLPSSGASLLPKVEGLRPLPVLSFSDGVGSLRRTSRGRPLTPGSDQFRLAAYQGDWKVVVDPSGKHPPKAFDVVHDPEEKTERWADEQSLLQPFVDSLQGVTSVLQKGDGEPLENDVQMRLKTWGYV